VLPGRDYLLLVVSLVEDWVVDAPWFMFDVALVVVDCWFALTPLVTDWLPLPTCTPGLMFAPAFTSELAMPTFASTPTFGFTLSDCVPVPDVGDEDELVPDVVPEVLAPDDWFVLVPWFRVEDEPMSVADWFALTPLFTVWLPLPMLTPGLTLAPRFTSVLLTPTFASTPTFGFTLSDEVLLDDEGDVEVLLDDDGDEVLPLVLLEVEPDVLPETLPELVLPVVPFNWLFVPEVPMRSLPPEIEALPDVAPFVAAFVP